MIMVLPTRFWLLAALVGEAALSAGAAVLFSCRNHSFHAKVNFGAKPSEWGAECILVSVVVPGVILWIVGKLRH